MKHFLIYTNKNKDHNLETTECIRQYLERKEQKVSVMVKDADWKEKSKEDTRKIPEDVHCMIVLGGDGTVLQAVRETAQYQVPIIGVNLGTLGYMTEIEPENLEEALNRLITGDYEQESRMMLTGKIFKREQNDDVKLAEGWALNDIVISRRGSLQIVKFNIYVNGQFLSSYHADGMIVSTPTGSTGYNLSAGGPIIEPKARLITLTPICPHSLNQTSIVLSPEDTVEVEIPEGREGRIQTVDANFDGARTVQMSTGDKIRITQSDKIAQFIQMKQESFLKVLHRKLGES